MASKKIAQVLLCRCIKNKKLFGITLEKRTGNDWEMIYSYPIDEQHMKSERFDQNQITAAMYLSSMFLGCPFCRCKSFFQCGICDRINCNGDSNSVPVECAWCNSRLTQFVSQDTTTASMGAD